MRYARLEIIIVGLLLVIFAGVVLHAPLTTFIGSLVPAVSLEIKAWKEVLLLVAFVLLIVDVSRRRIWRHLLDDWLLRLAALYALVHLALIPLSYQGLLPTVAGLMIDLRYVAFFAAVYVALRLYPRWRPLLVQLGIIGAVIVTGFAVLQVFVLPPDILRYIGYDETTIAPFMTVDQNDDYVRINSTLRGPNPLGAYAVIVLGVAAAGLLRRRFGSTTRQKIILAVTIIGASVAVLASYSRSAAVAAAVVVGVVLLITLHAKLSAKVWIGLLIAIGMITGGLVAARDTDFVSHVILHENPAREGDHPTSNDEHFESLITGTRQLLQNPLGSGIGSSGSASLLPGSANRAIIENQYFYVAHETGWPGLIVFLSLFIIILIKLFKRRDDYLALGVFASGIGLALIGLLLPVWADDTVAIVWWGLAAAALSVTPRGAQ